MKDLKRRAIAMTLALALNLGMAPAVFADEEVPAEETKQEAAIEQIEEVEKTEEIQQEAPAEETEMIEEKTEAAEEIKEEEKPEIVEEAKEEETIEVIEEIKEEAKVEEKVEEKLEAIEEIKVEEKTEAIEEIKAEAKVEVKTEAIEEIKTEAKSEEKKIEEFTDSLKEEAAKAELVKEELPKKELIQEAIAEQAPVEEIAAEDVIEEEIVEEPEYVSDAVSMTVSGNLTVYLENPDQTTQLTATNKNASNKKAEDQEIIWSSANESIATVDQDGLVTIVTDKPNKSVRITAEAANVEGLSVTKTVWTRNVTASTVNISMTSPTNTYIEGSEVQFTANIGPEYVLEALGYEEADAIWTVTNVTGEAEISADGLLSLLKAGTVKVTLSSSVTKNTHTKTITIKAPTPVSRLSLNATSVKMTMIGEKAPTKALKATVSPSTATNKDITWTSSDESIATVDDNGLVTAVGEGTAIITAASVSNPDVTAAATVTVEDLNNKEYTVSVKHYFTKTFVCDEMYNGVPSPYHFMVEDDPQTVKHGAIVNADDYIMNAPLSYPHTFTYNGQKYMLSGSYVAAKGVYGDPIFEAASDIDIIYTYSAIATYTMNYNFLDVETKEAVREPASRSYEIMLGYVEQPYNFTKTVNASTTLEGYNFVSVEGDVVGSFNEENANKTINLYFEKIKPVVEEPVIEEPVIEEPIVEEPVIEEPIVEEPIIEEPIIEEPIVEEPIVEEPVIEEPIAEEPIIEEPETTITEAIAEIVNDKIEEAAPVEEVPAEEPAAAEPAAEEIAEEETPMAAPAEAEIEEIPAEEPAVEEAPAAETETKHYRERAEKAEPVVETSSEETNPEEAEAIAEELEEEIEDEEAPLASFEAAEAETADTLVSSPLTGGGRHTGAWAGLSLVSLLGILLLNRKKNMAE